MKRFLILPLLLVLGGCALFNTGGTSVFHGGASLTAPVQNVTPQMLNDIEEGAKIGVAGLVGYRRLCIANKIDRSCRDTIAKIQVYTRPLCTEVNANQRCVTGVIADLRRFVIQNDQVNALKAFELARQLLTGLQATRAAAGV